MVTFDVADNQLDQIFISGQLHQERQQAAIAAAGMEAAATIAQQQDAMKAMEAAHQTALDELNFKNAGLLRTNQQQSELLKKAAETDRLYDALRTSIEEHLGIPHNSSIYDAIKAIKDENTALKARIAELEFASPPVTPPVVPVMPLKPIISKTELNYVAGACITLGFKPPSATVDATARELMKLISSMGFNTVRFFRNKDEVRDDLKRNPEDPRNLYAAAKKLGLTVVADTINRAALDLSDTELSQYLAGLKSLGAALLVFDDANQYNEPKKDGTRYPPNTLKDMVARVRQYSDLPILASVRANARVEDYKPLFEWVEFQTFGRLTELDDFLRLPADCFVLDGQATVGNDYLRGAHDVIMKYPPNAFFHYTSLDEDTDWRTMPDKVALIEKTVKAWNAARIVKAQPA